MTTDPRQRTAAYIALTASGILWGSSFILGKIALTGLTVDQMVLYRFLIATACFLPFVIRARPRLTTHEWMLVVLAGIVGVTVQFLLQFEGLARTSASHAALMIGTAPVLVAVAAFVVLRERLHLVTWFALAASTVGVVLIVLQNHSDSVAAGGGSFTGDLLVLASMFAAVVWIMVSKQLMVRHSPVVVTGLITTVGTIALIPWVLLREGLPPTALTPGVWAAVLALGFVCTVCTTALWNWGLSHVPAGKAGAFINLEPFVGAILGVWLLHEHLSATAILGGLIVVVGALVISFHDG